MKECNDVVTAIIEPFLMCVLCVVDECFLTKRVGFSPQSNTAAALAAFVAREKT